MEQFTASEVRDWERAYKGTGAAKVFGAFADLLEAREKAEPVYQHRSKSGPMFRWFDCSEEIFMAMEHNEHDRKHFDRRILYTHPAPADAERLAEALQPFANLFQALYATMPDDRPICGINKAEITAGDLRRANEALAAHSDSERLAEALHSIGERLSSVLCDPFGEVVVCGSDDDRQIIAQALKDLGALAAHSAQAQPPAVSVTDAIARRMVAEYDAVLCGDPTATRTDGMRAALEAALATQEGRNG